MKRKNCSAKTPISPVPHATIRVVWDAVTRSPYASITELSQGCRLGRSMVWRALHMLRDAGYVDFKDGTSRTRQVLLPFVMETLPRPGYRGTDG